MYFWQRCKNRSNPALPDLAHGNSHSWFCCSWQILNHWGGKPKGCLIRSPLRTEKWLPVWAKTSECSSCRSLLCAKVIKLLLKGLKLERPGRFEVTKSKIAGRENLRSKVWTSVLSFLTRNVEIKLRLIPERICVGYISFIPCLFPLACYLRVVTPVRTNLRAAQVKWKIPLHFSLPVPLPHSRVMIFMQE